MTSLTDERLKPLVLILGSLALAIFLFYGFLLLPMLGLQRDEIMFVYDLPHPHAAFAWFHFLSHDVAYMLMSYLGSLKSWLYAPLLSIARPSVWVIRAPALLIAALTILLTGKLLLRIQGWTAALVVVCLLATDVVFEVTAVFDWGPVVLQNFLLVFGLILLLKWHDNRRGIILFAAGIIFGLGLWDKALFIWNLSGIGVALLLLASSEIVRLWSMRRAALLFFGFCVGAAPLIGCNIKYPLITFRANSHFSLAEVGSKAKFLEDSLNGQAAPVALVLRESRQKSRSTHPFESLALALAGPSTDAPNTWRFISGIALLLLGLLLAPNSQRKWILFFLISGAVGWFESAMTQNAGGSIHHTVLFWINWYCAVALSAAGVARCSPRLAVSAIISLTLLLSLRGALSENLTYANLLSFSPQTGWTTADSVLAASLLQSGVKRAISADWGIANVLGVRSNEKIDVREEEFELNADKFDRDVFAGCSSPSCVVITHAAGRMMFPGVAKKLEDSLTLAHLAKTNLATVSDERGKAMFSVFGIRLKTHVISDSTGKITPAGLRYQQSSDFRFWATPAPAPLDETESVRLIHWSAPGVTTLEIRVQSPTGNLFARGPSTGDALTGPWVASGSRFYLEDGLHDKKMRTGTVLAELVLK